ncbi:MAG: M28 family peptidase [Calditrichaceae bacterium]|nr:M28 family peptidase [Calditrichaceae bacterium]MBN2708559.1 M28 family peptidase [Calditrichaceae bacterium]
MMRRILCGLLFLWITAFAQDFQEQAKADIAYLTSQELMGRGYTFNGHIKAAEFLAQQFKSIGLEPVGGDYFQEFEMDVNLFEPVPALFINDVRLKPGADFFPNAVSGSGKREQETNILYINAGLYIPEKNINDYAAIDRENAVLVIEDEVPPDIKSDKTIDRQVYSKDVRIALAKEYKARAVIFLVNNLVFSSPRRQESLPVFDVKKTSWPEKAESVSYRVESSFEEVQTNNVLGLLPGTSKADSFFILCAHYDHLSALGDSLYFPGANDNASGVGMILSMARYFKQNPLRHSILFIAFSGEETGLVGSKFFAEHPVLDIGKARFLINFDMVASGKEAVMAVGGEDFPDYFNMLNTVNDSLNIGTLRKRKNVPNGDHFPILEKGVKGFFLYTDKGTQPYHSFRDIYDTLEWEDFLYVYKLSKAFIEKIDR